MVENSADKIVTFKTMGMATILDDTYNNKYYVKRQNVTDSNLYLWGDPILKL